VARSSAGRSGADKPESDSNEFEQDISDDQADLEVDEGDISRTRQTDEFWTKAKMEPIEIALPGGVGYTLRAYRLNTEITPSDYTAREEDEFPDRKARYGAAAAFDDELVDEDEDDELLDELEDDELDEDTDDDEDADHEDDDDADDDEDPEEEVPLFLSQGGHLLLFRSRAGLVDFISSDAEHDLTQLSGWAKLARQIRTDHIVPVADETYELDLVVKNLRAGSDSWDPDLIVQSGQIARDLGHALRIESVVKALAAGSPLDDLDEALRAVASGGMGSFFARRKAKKIGTEAASIGWRTVIGKISAVVDWRD
jgi:hypothetical protein